MVASAKRRKKITLKVGIRDYLARFTEGVAVMNLVEIGMRIQDARKKKGLNQDQFAELLDVSKQTVSSIERGTKGTKLTNFVKICQILDISADYLLFGK